ncbi:hypothetical protein CGZ93_16195 [Enemella dayhoffiae]|uniref:Uncharacterized protein n=1 Tax=Enemella dayhoffiae TaxID=2016507 RepID=A0A255GQJ7_9ACTN|nr:hypothetical protein [Enemella dayhoffiae]OYO18095.1 hypothetical protein CGZ93_16195 [Enemella dayhoffiae]
MPTYVLEGGGSARLPAKPLTLRLQTPGSTPVRLLGFRDGQPDHSAITPMPGMLVLPRVDGPIEVRAVPDSGRTFGSGTVASLSAAIELHGDPDPERAVIPSVDLSGLAQRDLVRVERVGNELVLTAMGVVHDTPLPPLAARARDLAREILGLERIPDDQARALQVVVDGSASMRPLVGEGSVAAVVEVLVGLSRVTAGERELTAQVASDRARPVQVGSVEELPRAVHDLLTDGPMATGFRIPAADSGAEVARCVVSDGVPAGFGVPDRNAEGEGAEPMLVLLAARSAREVLAARAPRGTAFVEVGDWGAASAYDQLLADERMLRELVSQLLAGLLPENSSFRARVSGVAPEADADMTVLRARY